MGANTNRLSSILISVMVILCLNSCTVYTEKQSEALSQTVHATKDSIDVGRIDLADKYIDQASRIVKPPKKRIDIKPVFKSTINTLASNSKESPTYNKVKQRVVIIPERYKNDTVVVVSSDEYNQLLKDKEVYKQLETDFKNLQDTKLVVDDELMRQMEYRDKMIRDLNIMQKKLVEKDLAILQRNIIIVVLAGAIGGMVYIRFKGGALF
jgi:hypothetical protein